MPTIVPLRQVPECIGTFVSLFEQEWPAWYGAGGRGNAGADLAAYGDPSGQLPVGVVARAHEGSFIGIAALKTSGTAQHAHLGPWAGAGYVVPGYRRREVGAALLSGLLAEARRLGHPTIYCATSTSVSLLERQGGRLLEWVEHDGAAIAVYAIAAPAIDLPAEQRPREQPQGF